MKLIKSIQPYFINIKIAIAIAGIKTSIEQVQNYLNRLNAAIEGSYKQEFLKNINITIGQNASEKLANMHSYDNMQNESSIEINGGYQQPILSIDLYWELEQQVKVLIYLIRIMKKKLI